MTIAQDLAALVAKTVGVELPVRLRAWDDSEAGPQDNGPVLHIRRTEGLRRLLWRPGELGMAQAYVLGEIDVIGDLRTALRRVWSLAGHTSARPGLGARLSALPFAWRHGIVGPRPSDPDLQAALSGREHSRARDKAAISFHYDQSNDFFALLLDANMVYSCGYWIGTGSGYGLADAQRDKLDLICRKLNLGPGARLLDVGCGWGALAIHAATHYETKVDGVTLSRQQHEYATARAARLGVNGRVRFQLRDFRDVPDTAYDAVATVEMGEHVGQRGYPRFAARLRELLKPGGNLLVQQMSRSANRPGGGAFIESYIAPDMHMRPVGQTVDLLEQAGLEIRGVEAMREHYVHTTEAWLAELESRWDEVVTRFGEPFARVWRLYLTGGSLAFEQRRMGVDQILAVRPGPAATEVTPLPHEQMGRAIESG